MLIEGASVELNPTNECHKEFYFTSLDAAFQFAYRYHKHFEVAFLFDSSVNGFVAMYLSDAAPSAASYYCPNIYKWKEIAKNVSGYVPAICYDELGAIIKER